MTIIDDKPIIVYIQNNSIVLWCTCNSTPGSNETMLSMSNNISRGNLFAKAAYCFKHKRNVKHRIFQTQYQSFTGDLHLHRIKILMYIAPCLKSGH